MLLPMGKMRRKVLLKFGSFGNKAQQHGASASEENMSAFSFGDDRHFKDLMVKTLRKIQV